MSLFPESEVVPLPKGHVLYMPEYFCQLSSNSVFDVLMEQTPFQPEYVKIGGKFLKAPRQTAYYGARDYLYAGIVQKAKSWTTYLAAIRSLVESELDTEFNSALLNFYPDGNSYIGWHADDEKSLGNDPVIASISLGATRKFSFKDKQTKEVFSLQLENGSLLFMGKGTQINYLHSLPKQKDLGPRINITFRYIYD